jgi:uncharacterized protein (TIGR00251 family)
VGRSIGEPKGGDFRMRGWPAWLEARPHGFALALHVQPGARRTAVIGPHGDRLKLAVATPPVDGRANEALIEFLAKRLGLPKAHVVLLAGANAREKRVALETSLTAEALLAALAPA